jgi:outer membrane protein OmpA-like peptidoglycan-associated protein
VKGDLQVQVDAYDTAIADLMSGGDATAAQANMDAARAQIASICAAAGYPDANACLADNGLQLTEVPGLAPAEPAPAEQPAPEAPAEQPAAPAEQPAAELPPEPTEVIENLPKGVTQEQVAPVLDSAKDVDSNPAAETQLETTVAAEPVAPPPESDAAAQSAEIRAFAAEAPAEAEQGTAVTATDNTTVTQTVNNTYVNNITNITNVTNTTNNTTNNTQNNTQNNIGQQNNITVVEQAPIRAADRGDTITQVILQVGTQLIVNSIGQDTDRFYNPDQDEIYYENLSNGRTREVITRPDGSQIITVRNRNGDVLRRSRLDPAGREYVFANFDDRYDNDLASWRDPGQDLPPLRLNIPVQDYVLDADQADDQQVEVFFRQPPVEQVARLYSIDEVKRSARVRDSVRKLEVGGLTFDTGAATISRDQVGALSSVANAMLKLLATNPAETFLIEGHTDAVGSDISNLQLSDLRAATVARILTDFYKVPPENLATQGYGERYLRIRTDAAERENRRVTIRRITPLITMASN